MFLSSFSLKGYALWKTSIQAPLPGAQQISLVNVASAPPRPSEPLAQAQNARACSIVTILLQTPAPGSWEMENRELLNFSK